MVPIIHIARLEWWRILFGTCILSLCVWQIAQIVTIFLGYVTEDEEGEE